MRLKKIYKIFLSFITLLYPIGIIFKSENLDIAVLILGLFWSLNLFVANDNQAKILSFFIALFFLLSFYLKSSILSYFYPVLINAFLLFTFLFSLKTTPIITRFALIREKSLSNFAEKYTRNLTKIWALFFSINGTIAFFLIFVEDKSYWAYYNGFLSYILIGVFFMIEFVFRIILKRRYDD